LGILSIILSLVYPLNDKRIEQIGAELSQRRREAGGETAVI